MAAAHRADPAESVADRSETRGDFMVPVVYCRFSRREDVEEHEAQDQDDNQDGDSGFCSVIA